MRVLFAMCFAAALGGCTTPTPTSAPAVVDAWDAVRIGAYDNRSFARLFTEVGGYETISEADGRMVLRHPGGGARVELEELPPSSPQARPPDAQSWEPGCYWSLMVRARGLESIVEEARALGWEPRTPVAYLEFGPSKLHIVVLTHRATGTQVQFYERLGAPPPDGYPAFDRFGTPFNIMQMSGDVGAGHRFFTEELGFATFYKGGPTVAEEGDVMPLGVPAELATAVPYHTAIVYPEVGMETGRFEVIEVEGERLGPARDFRDQCDSGSVGLTAVMYDARSADERTRTVVSPDGAPIMFGYRR